MELVSSDKTKCIKCHACEDICPMQVIQPDIEGFPGSTRDTYKLCINCGFCVDVCVLGALHHGVRRPSGYHDPALKRLKRIREHRAKRGQKNA